MQKEKTVRELSKMIQIYLKETQGKVLISMIHENLYGPLRDLHYILLNPNPDFLANYLYDGWEKIGIHVHQKVLLATKPMILPFDMLEQITKTTPQVSTIQKGEEYIKYMLTENSDQDPFYYRLGIL
jgi:hypothetical protein